jgi:ABC-type uncharacterized transport system involved in gliding motility auxiliary subunit
MALMKITKTHLAWAGIVVAAIAAIFLLVLFIIQREFSLAIQISLAVFILGIAIFVILETDRLRAAMTGRQARYGSNLILLSVAILGILVVVNYLAINNPKRWDLTETGEFTLSPETIDTIESLPNPVTIYGFYSPNFSSDQAEALLDQYKFHGDGRISYQFINPFDDPLFAEKYNVTRDGTLVLVSGEVQEQLNLVTEREITSSLVRIISPGERKVYFLTGHGEYDPEAFGEDSYSQVKSTLESKNYLVEKLNLAAEKVVPVYTSAVIIAGPVNPVPQLEVDMLQDYIESGGALLILQEPTPLMDLGNSVDPLAAYLADEWGIRFGDDMVVDLDSSQPLAPFADRYSDHLITEKMQGITTVYPTARSVTADSSVTAARLLDLVLTSPRSWAETDLETLVDQSAQGETPEVQLDEGTEMMGPISLALTMEDSSTSARMVVFGDSDFAADINYFQYGNGDMFVNSVDWLTRQDELINLTPKAEIQRLMIPPGKYTLNIIFFGSVVLLPAAILITGAAVWFKRRSRG